MEEDEDEIVEFNIVEFFCFDLCLPEQLIAIFGGAGQCDPCVIGIAASLFRHVLSEVCKIDTCISHRNYHFPEISHVINHATYYSNFILIKRLPLEF